MLDFTNTVNFAALLFATLQLLFRLFFPHGASFPPKPFMLFVETYKLPAEMQKHLATATLVYAADYAERKLKTSTSRSHTTWAKFPVSGCVTSSSETVAAVVTKRFTEPKK